MKQTNGTKKLLSQVWRLTRSYWKSEEKKKAYALLLAILVLTLAVVAMLVLLNQWNNAFYTALQNYQTEEIFYQLKRFTVLAFIYIILAVYAYYLQQVLVLNWRRWLTNRYIDRWLQHRTYYRLEMFGKEMDNPDQRISEDVNLFVTKTLGFFVGIVKALCTLVSFCGDPLAALRAFFLCLSGTHLAPPWIYGLGGRGLCFGGHLADSPGRP